MSNRIAPENLLYLDIETVPAYSTFNELPDRLKPLWEDKFSKFSNRNPQRYPEDYTADEGYREAGIFAEFGKIVCISVGYIHVANGTKNFKLKSYAGEDERKLLQEFADMISKWETNPKHSICGHNIKEFDIPYIARRMVILQIPLPNLLQVAGKKPWEISFVDTMELWKFGDFKHYTSLSLLTAVFNIPTPKDDIDGSMVRDVFYEEKDVQRIAIYCEKDVLATAQVYLYLAGHPLLDPDNIEVSPN